MPDSQLIQAVKRIVILCIVNNVIQFQQNFLIDLAWLVRLPKQPPKQVSPGAWLSLHTAQWSVITAHCSVISPILLKNYLPPSTLVWSCQEIIWRQKELWYGIPDDFTTSSTWPDWFQEWFVQINLDNQQQQQQQSSRIHPVANCCIRPNSTDPDTRVVKPLIYLFDKHEQINKGQFNID